MPTEAIPQLWSPFPSDSSLRQDDDKKTKTKQKKNQHRTALEQKCHEDGEGASREKLFLCLL